MLEEAYGKTSMKKTQVYECLKPFRFGHETSDSFYTTEHPTSDVRGQKVPCQTQCGGFVTSAIFPGLVPDRLLLVSANKMCFERARIHERRVSHCKRGENTYRGIEKWFPGMFSKALRTKGNKFERKIV
jgi:hypothetical protein